MISSWENSGKCGEIGHILGGYRGLADYCMAGLGPIDIIKERNYGRQVNVHVKKGKKQRKKTIQVSWFKSSPAILGIYRIKILFFIPILFFVHMSRLLLYYEKRNLSALVRIVILEVYTVSDKQAGLSLRGFTFFPSIPCQIVPPALYMFSLICRHHHLINLPLPASWKKCQDDTNCRPNKSGAKKKVFLDKCSYNLSAPLPLVTSSQHD